jgi:diguanylate cyclase (GGDEF)-like protein
MDRSGLVRVARGSALVLSVVLALGAVVLLAEFPPLRVAATRWPWLADAVIAVVTLSAVVAALAALIDGLRHRHLAPLLEAGSAAAIAGGAIVTFARGNLAGPLLVAALMLAGSAVTAGTTIADDRRARVVAGGVMLVGEASAVAGALPAAHEAAATLLAAAGLVAGVVTLASAPSRLAVMAGALAIGAAGLLLDRAGSLESLIGTGAIAVGQLVALAIPRAVERAADPREPLPALADRLADPVLRFDGQLALVEWNRAAGELLGLDGSSVGQRAEDVLGISMAALPAGDDIVVTRGGAGGLDVALHRSGDGVTAIVRDPAAAPESERLAAELRTTIEELLRARRTIALQRGELERSTTIDPLTGVATRGAILERVRIEVAQARRYQHPLAVVLLDVDGFGDLNARHGLTGGDAILREVALRFRVRVREADAIGRYGSDGFIAALPHTDEAGAATFANALRHRLSLRPVAVDEAEVRITVSIGVAIMRPGEDLDLDGVLARVDEALDSARSAGGDRIALDRLHGLARLGDPDTAPPQAGDGGAAREG